MRLKIYYLLAITILLSTSCSESRIQPEVTTHEVIVTSPPAITATRHQANNYIGLIHPPLPSSIRTSTSWASLIYPSSSSQIWSVEVVADENSLMLWLSKLLDNDQSGKAYSQVTDVEILSVSLDDYDRLLEVSYG